MTTNSEYLKPMHWRESRKYSDGRQQKGQNLQGI